VENIVYEPSAVEGFLIREPTSDVRLFVYGDAGFSSELVCSSDYPGSESEWCEYTPWEAPDELPSLTRHVIVDGSMTGAGATYQLNIDP
jgi:hypothetical protein